MTPKGSPPSRFRRLLRIAIGLCLLLVVVVLLLPFLAGWLGPGIIERVAGSRLNGRAAVKQLSVSYSGDVKLRDLEILDEQDRSVLTVRRADLDAELWPAVSGDYRAVLTVDGFELHVRPGREQAVNLIELPKRKERPPKVLEPKTRTELPAVRLDAEFKNGLVVVHGLEGRTELRELALALDLDGLDREGRFSFSAELHGPAGPSGRMASHGTFLAVPPDRSPDGSPDRSPDRVDLNLDLEGLLLEALAPALSLVASTDGLSGRLDADLQARLTGQNAVVGSGSLNLRDLRVPATREGAADLVLKSVVLEGQADLDAGGHGRQSIRLDAAELLALQYDGEMQLGDDGARSLAGEVRLEGQMEAMARAAEAFVPLEPGLTFGGRLQSTAHFDLSTKSGGGLPRGRLQASLEFPELSAKDAAGQPIDLGELASSRFSFDSGMDPESGTLTLSELSAHLGSVRVTGQASLSGWTAEFSPEALFIEPSRFEIEADLDRLAGQLEAVADLESLDLGGALSLRITAEQEQDRIRLGTTLEPRAVRALGLLLEGSPLQGNFVISKAPEQLSMQGGFETAELAVTLKDGRLVRQADVKLDLDLSRSSAGELRIQSARYASSTATAELTGSASALGDAQARQAELNLTLRGQMANILSDLGALLRAEAYRGQGELTAGYQLRQEGPRVTLLGETRIDGLNLEIPGRKEGSAPMVLTEPSVLVKLDSALLTDDGIVDLKTFSIDSKTLWGQLDGRLLGLLPGADSTGEILLENIQGTFTYIPDRLGALLSPLLTPAELAGSQEEQLTLDLSGRFDEFDPMTLLESSRGDLKVGLGTFRLPGTETTGTLALGLDQGRAQLSGDLGANGGTLDLTGDLGRREEDAKASLSLDLKQFQVNAELGDLLSMLHPLFATLGQGQSNRLGGVVECNVKLDYGQPLSLRELAANWSSLDPRQIQGDIFFQIEQAVLEGSPLFETMLEQFGLTRDQELVVSPMRFHVDGGRVNYAEPWKWRLGGVKTSFTGSVGFDRTLDLRWNVPINKRLVKKHGFLEILEGESVEIPLTGTTAAPNLEWGGILRQLAQKAAKKKLAEETGLGDLEGLGGLGGLGGLLGGNRESQEDSKQLLEQADALWDQGKKRRAAKIYRRLEKEFKLTSVYLLNRDRIEERADFKPD